MSNNNLQKAFEMAFDSASALANLKIEELEKRIMAGGEDTVACVLAAKKLIQEDAARSADRANRADIDAVELAESFFRLWRQGEIAVGRTLPDGRLLWRSCIFSKGRQLAGKEEAQEGS
jgi:hypothetical protein